MELKSLSKNEELAAEKNTEDDTEKTEKESNSIHECLTKCVPSLRSSLYADAFIAEVDKHYRRVACSAILVWIILVGISFHIGKKTNTLKVLDGNERQAPIIGALILAMSLLSAVLPLFLRRNRPLYSGVIVCAVTAQSVACATNLLLAFGATPVLIDPISGMKTYLLRYCEWTPLAFLMAFLTDSCRIDNISYHASLQNQSGDISKFASAMSSSMTMAEDSSDSSILCAADKKRDIKDHVMTKLKSAYYLAIAQGTSAFAGWVFPFCPNLISWSICMFVSCALFALLWKRLYTRSKAFQAMKPGSTLSEQENYTWNKLSLGLLRTCAYAWSSLVVVFCTFAIGPNLWPNSRLFSMPWIQVLLECFIDVMLKVFYLTAVLEVHRAIFDTTARAKRRLKELSRLLSAVWDNSSDMIIISTRGVSGDISSMLNPTCMKFYSKNKRARNHKNTLAFDLNASCLSSEDDPIPSNFYGVALNDEFPSFQPWSKNKELTQSEMTSLSKLVIRAWKAEVNKEEEMLMMHDLVRGRGPSIRCEANITTMEENALVIVVRDISERYRRFEAEKKAASEATARLRDAAANRFTRHEVKNGLLSAVALCDSLNESVQDMSNRIETLEHLLSEKNDDDLNHNISSSDVDEHNKLKKRRLSDSLLGKRRLSNNTLDKQNQNTSAINHYIYELDKTLQEILDTVLAEAMARDVIWEGYEPKLERVKVSEVLSTANAGMSSMQRFPFESSPEILPDFSLDPQLLKYIHRNAISNACKYGQKSGVITTKVFWNKEQSELRMVVINLPGERHSEILQLGALASEVVFAPRKRLAVHCDDDDNNPHSSGDGAWIMDKCAKTLGGKCEILFEPEKTTFSFTFPVKLYNITFSNKALEFTNFELPKNIYAIAIDDSKIQRKLLTRFFEYAGIRQDRTFILGSTAEEITTFCDYAIAFVDEHPDDFVLMIVDENLDVKDKGTMVSGSSAVAEMRSRLLPDQERRVLALIRSANDSSKDVSIYKARAHGYLPKEPIKKDKVLECLAPLWLARFPHFKNQSLNTESRNKISSYDDVVITMDDIIPLIDDIDLLISEENLNWFLTWEKLHALKGDLQIMPNKEDTIRKSIVLISNLKGDKPPENVRELWECIRDNLIR
mmetsp:Transcript_13156/g.19347  ORF Transcript_13156/g.19347 Transcript_13156/m.19347 type:complete len:1134 (+) Transcript_13156:88-3489(+)